MPDSARIQVEITPAELRFLQDKRREHAIPEAIGHPMPYDAAARGWGEEPPANPVTITRLVSPQDWVTKQIRNLQAVGETNYREGITRPKRSPIAAGIAAQPAYETAMRNPAVLARRAEALRKTNDEEWASRSERIGAPRLVSGVTDRIAKVERAVGSYHGRLSAHLQRIDQMPAITDSDRERRMVENLKGLRAMKGTI